MPDIRSLTLELEHRLEAPEFDLLVGVAGRRRRVGRLALVGAAAAVASVVAVSSLAQERASTLPAAPSEQARQLADIVHNPRALLVRDAHAPHDPSTKAELWTRCNGDTSATSGHCGSAVTVSTDGIDRAWLLTGNEYPHLAFLSDGRFYLQAADGHAQLLDPRLPDPVDLTDLRSQRFVPPRTGPATTRCFTGLLCLVDLTAGTVAPMDVDSQHWSAGRDPLLWGYADTYADDAGRRFSYEARWVGSDGQRGRHVLVTRAPQRVIIADADPDAAMAFYVVPVDWNTDDPVVAHSTWTSASLQRSDDRGATWTVRKVPRAAVEDVVAGRVPEDWGSWPGATP